MARNCRVESCLYVGRIRHRRYEPRPHAFRYGLFMLYLDLGELDRVFAGRWLWSATRPAVARFRRADHVGPANVSLDVAVRDLVETRTGSRPDGPIRLLTHLRYLGYGFNPVSFYYCFAADGVGIKTIVADVSNTPWGERHQYVLPVSSTPGRGMRFTLDKQFHVSPFMPMDIEYDWRFTAPGRGLGVQMISRRAGRTVFDASLGLMRRPIDGPGLAYSLLRYPAMTAQVITGIYTQAVRLWWKGTPAHPRPSRATGTNAPAASPSTAARAVISKASSL